MSTGLAALPCPSPQSLPGAAEDWLASLPGPVWIRVPGRDRSRCRLVTTLLHGNEPSGFRAFHAWLRAGETPAVDAVLVIANVEAARAAPGFAHRMLAGRRDLNRCFLGPFEGPDGVLARALLARIEADDPEAVLDLHNNTGHNPPYGVGVRADPSALALVALFADRFVLSHLRLGALMEALGERPAATIEVGRSGEPAADAVALAGLSRFFGEERVLPAPGDARPKVSVLSLPMRVCLRAGARLAVADDPIEGADLTIHADLDRHNFERVEAGTPIGWIRGGPWPLELRDEAGVDRAAEYFAREAGRLLLRRPITPIMITTDPGIAAADCLFYVVQELPGEPGSGA